MNLHNLLTEWRDAKRAEQDAATYRRQVEDRLVEALSIPDNLDGSMTQSVEGFKVKVTGRIDRKVDSKALQEIAQENGLSEHLSTLFRWKPEINMAAWKATSPEITAALADAITAKPGRPSFAIEKEKPQ